MRIAHLTDLHLRHHLFGSAGITSRRSRLMAELFEQALGQIKAQGADFIAVTGDLLDVPTWLVQPIPGFETDDPEPWRAATLADYRLVQQLLDATGLPYMVLSGNHDHPELMWEVFDREANIAECAGYRVVRFCDHEHEGHVPRRFWPDRPRWLEALAADDGVPQVHLQHYVVTPTLNEGYPHTYAEGEDITAKTAAAGHVRLSISGHYHTGTDLIAQGSATFVTGPAFCERPFRWRTYDVGPQGVEMAEHALGAAAMPTQPVVFLDRDGVINDRAAYRQGPEVMHLIPGSAAAIRQLNDAGYAVVVVTNQSCVGGGYVSPAVVGMVNERMCRLLAEEAGAQLTAIYAAFDAGPKAVLPQYRDQSNCKPNPTMLNAAIETLDLDRRGMWMVGDTVSDAMAARAAGAAPVLVRTGHGEMMAAEFGQAFPDAPVVADLAAAVSHILGHRE